MASCRSATVANGRAAKARSATHGACSKMPPSAPTKEARSAPLSWSRVVRRSAHCMRSCVRLRPRCSSTLPAASRRRARGLGTGERLSTITAMRSLEARQDGEIMARKPGRQRTAKPRARRAALRPGADGAARCARRLHRGAGPADAPLSEPRAYRVHAPDRGLDGGGRHERAHRPAAQPVRPLRGQDAAARPPS